MGEEEKPPIWRMGLFVTLLFAIAHWVYQGGWCGYYDGGPKPGRRFYCHHLRPFGTLAIILIPGVIGTFWASRAKTSRSAILRLCFSLGFVVIAGVVLPFRVGSA